MEYEKFIEDFQSSKTLWEVCDKTGLSYQRVTSLASKLRKKGIPLKYMRKNYMTPERVKKLAEKAQNAGI
jgi:hypothetical protein